MHRSKSVRLNAVNTEKYILDIEQLTGTAAVMDADHRDAYKRLGLRSCV